MLNTLCNYFQEKHYFFEDWMSNLAAEPNQYWEWMFFLCGNTASNKNNKKRISQEQTKRISHAKIKAQVRYQAGWRCLEEGRWRPKTFCSQTKLLGHTDWSVFCLSTILVKMLATSKRRQTFLTTFQWELADKRHRRAITLTVIYGFAPQESKHT